MILSLFLVNPKSNIWKFKKHYRKWLFVKLETIVSKVYEELNKVKYLQYVLTWIFLPGECEANPYDFEEHYFFYYYECRIRNSKKIAQLFLKGHSSVLHCASLLRIHLRLISARTSARTLRKWRLLLYSMARASSKSSFSRKQARWPIIFFSLSLSLVNAFFLYSEYKQIFIVEKWVINGNVNFASSSENKFVASRSLHVWNKLNRCHAFVVKHTVICFLKLMQCFYC